MKKRLRFWVLANVFLFAVSTVGRPSLVRAAQMEGPYNCCKTDTEEKSFCCAGCCWSPTGPTCTSSSQCQ